ncbi:hypothetical protein NPIL_568711 [Nephila pilipes]|uniref:Uncharacterized protein n=1 Tax=Nephila pilipes TaxID=299642 RepID=A0A8X6JQL0_NEPPI|nr:hypothetical protein NPIL_25831 [Nephila pilipes]GFT95250.1 hypothetical protein NPIL_568711 [Nephila pilipes]
MQLGVNAVHLDTDSTRELSWIRTQPHLLKRFITNRVVRIADLTSEFKCQHIKSNVNPADPLRRSLSADELIGNKLWWLEPELLHIDTNLSKYQEFFNINPRFT